MVYVYEHIINSLSHRAIFTWLTSNFKYLLPVTFRFRIRHECEQSNYLAIGIFKEVIVIDKFCSLVVFISKHAVF